MIPLTISFRGMEHSEAIEALIRKQVSMLEHLAPRALHCRVVVELPHRHHREGRTLHLRIDLVLPGEHVIVEHQPSLHAEIQRREGAIAKSTEPAAPFDDPSLAIRAAFRSAARRLQDDVRRRRLDVKAHEPQATARVVRLFPDDDYGFLETADGREVYFHANAVLNRTFEHVAVGDRVRFVEEPGTSGPQATTVEIISRAKAPS